MASGSMRDRIAFYRLEAAQDEYGNDYYGGFDSDPFLTRPCEFVPEMGREVMAADKAEARGSVRVRLHRDSQVEAVSERDKAVIRGEDYQIRYIEPHQSGCEIWMLLERGVSA